MTRITDLQHLMERPPAWLPLRSKPGDILISSRIRLARNLKDYAFPLCLPPAGREEVASRFFHAVETLPKGNEWQCLAMDPLSDNVLSLLFERKLASREFLTREKGRYLAFAPDAHFTVMINEEDHLRMQYCHSGEHLSEAWRKLSALDSQLQKELDFAYLPGKGYATSCPSNLGTGIRASLMLHLPALRLMDRIKTILNALQAMNLTARGLDGEGAEITGNLYQISNQSTLGESEEGILQRLLRTADDLIKMEQSARMELLGNHRARLMDFCARAYAVVKYSYMISSGEALQMLSAVRLGVDLGFFPDIKLSDLNRLLLLVQCAHLSFRAGRVLSPEERGIARASLLRSTFGNNAPGVPEMNPEREC